MTSFALDTRPDGVTVLTFDQPGEKVNKLSTPVMDELSLLLEKLVEDEQIKALVIASGKKDIFIAGADIAEIRDVTDAATGEALSRRGQSIMQKLVSLPFPTIAAIHGACMGGGLELALACSHRVASDHAKTMLGLPEVNIGIIPGFGGTQRLPRLIGIRHAVDMIVTGKSIDAKRAAQIGLVNEVASPLSLMETALKLAKQAAAQSRASTVQAKRPFIVRLLQRNPLMSAFLYRTARRSIDTTTRGNYPAPTAALDAVQHGLAHGLHAGYENEAQLFGHLSASEVSKNLINVFYLKGQLQKDSRPLSFAIDHVGIVHAGGLDECITDLFRERGVALQAQDITPAIKAKGSQPIGRLDLSSMSSTELVIASVGENKEAVMAVLREFEQDVKAKAIFAPRSALLSITELAKVSQCPERVVGLLFHELMENAQLVEIIRGKQTSMETISAVAGLSRRLGRLPVIVNDGPGALVHRILMIYFNEALRMLEEGCGIEMIDRALLAFGMQKGAFTLLDAFGIDMAYAITDRLHANLGERLRPPAILERLYKEGFRGKKNGRGFYRYERGVRKGIHPLVAGLTSAQKAGSFLDQEIVERIILQMIREAVLCLEDKIIDRPDLLDAATVFGMGFPTFRGGLLKYAESLGAKHIVERLEVYKARYGERFTPPASLFEMSRDDFIGQIVG